MFNDIILKNSIFYKGFDYMFRNTYVEVNLQNITYNVQKLISLTNNYKYHFGVVKADCYRSQ